MVQETAIREGKQQYNYQQSKELTIQQPTCLKTIYIGAMCQLRWVL